MRDYLNRAAEIVTAALFLDNREVDLTGGEVALFRESGGCVALVMAQVEIGLSAVIGNKDFAMLER